VPVVQRGQLAAGIVACRLNPQREGLDIMSQTDFQNASGIATRRHFLSRTAGVAAGGAVLALATIRPAAAVAAPASPLDPVFGLIETHRTARAAHLASIDEQTRLELLGDPDAESVAEGPCDAEWDSLDALIGTAPVTFAGLVAWAAYLDQIRRDEEWMLEDRSYAASGLIATLVEALGNLEVAS
jgi:hypothetical protein